MAPDIDADVTGRELDRSMHHELKALEPSNAERVAQHLVMAARYLEEDPEFALEHANAAVRKAGRIGVVREAAGVAAYAAGDFALALKELRTHRRISGSQEHLPLMVDSQRALGRADKAMEEATSDAASSLDAAGRAALAIVVSGIHADGGDHDAALAALEIPQLDKNRGFSYSPDLFRAYAEALRAVGRDREAGTWERQAIVAEAALGVGQFSEPEIVDLGDDLDEDEARRTVQDAQRRHSAPHPDHEDAGAGDSAPSHDLADGARNGTVGKHAGRTRDEEEHGAADGAANGADAAEPSTPSDSTAAEQATGTPARHDGVRRAGPEEAPENEEPEHDETRDVAPGTDRQQDTSADAVAADGRDDVAGTDGASPPTEVTAASAGGAEGTGHADVAQVGGGEAGDESASRGTTNGTDDGRTRGEQNSHE